MLEERMNEFWRSTCVGGKKERQVWGLKVKTGLTGRRSSWAEYIYRMTFLRIRLLSNWVPVAPWHPHPPVVGDLCGEAAVLCSHHRVHFRCLYFTKVFPFYAEYFTLVLHYITEWSTVLLTPLDLFQQHWKGSFCITSTFASDACTYSTFCCQCFCTFSKNFSFFKVKFWTWLWSSFVIWYFCFYLMISSFITAPLSESL